MEGGITGAGTESRRNRHLEASCPWSFQETAGNCLSGDDAGAQARGVSTGFQGQAEEPRQVPPRRRKGLAREAEGP